MKQLHENERNGSLIESETVSDDPLDMVSQKLDRIYDTVFSRNGLKAKVGAVANEYRYICGHRPEFWYMLAVGVELANTQTFGRDHNVYLAEALALTTPSRAQELHSEYYTRLRNGIRRRYKASDCELAREIRGQYWAPLQRVERLLEQLGIQQPVDAL